MDKNLGPAASPKDSPAARELAASPYELALGLLWSDRRVLLWIYAVLIAPRLFLTLSNPSDASTLFLTRLSERVLELLVAALLLQRSLRTFGAAPDASQRGAYSLPHIATLLLFLAIGLLSWLTLLCPSNIIPFEILFTVGSPGGIGPALFMALPAAFVWYLHYFWSFTLLLPRLSLAVRIALCRNYVQLDPWSPVKSVLGASAIMYLPTFLILSLYPDGRSLELSLFADSLSGIQWLLATYVILGFGYSLLPAEQWHQVGLDRNRATRLATVQLLGTQHTPTRIIASLLRPKIACQLLGLCCLVWGANMARLAQLPPSPTLDVTRVWIDNRYSLRVEMNAKDSDFRFRGFRPLQFRITNRDGTELWAAFPESATIDGAVDDVRVFFPLRHDLLSLQLSFRDMRPPGGAEFPEYALWYGGVKIAEIVPEASQTAQATAP